MEPEREVPRALRSMVVRLGLFYIVAIALVVAIVPWQRAGLAESPFVTVFRSLGVPYAAGVMNFVVLTAALSSMNTNLYLSGRMLFSLARSGFAPAAFGRLSAQGAPRSAILASTIGLALAAVLAARFAGSAYQWLLGIAIFGGILVWIAVLVTLIAFRRARARQGIAPGTVRMPLYPWLPHCRHRGARPGPRRLLLRRPRGGVGRGGDLGGRGVGGVRGGSHSPPAPALMLYFPHSFGHVWIFR